MRTASHHASGWCENEILTLVPCVICSSNQKSRQAQDQDLEMGDAHWYQSILLHPRKESGLDIHIKRQVSLFTLNHV